MLSKRDWPGNVRELENSLRRIIALSNRGGALLGVYDLPDEFRPTAEELRQADEQAEEAEDAFSEELPQRNAGLTLKAFLRIHEREYISQVLAECGGDKEKTAKLLGISKGTLYRKLEETE